MKLSVNGRTVRGSTGGMEPPPDAPAMILLHGAGMDGTVWSMQSRYFARHGYRVLALDLPGHGGSEGPVLVSVPEIANWVGAVMDEAGIETTILAGHSMGALAALHLAGSAPHRVAGLALLGAATTMQVHPDLQAAADNNPALAAELITDWGYSPDMHRGGHQLPGFWAMGAGMALLKGAKDGVLSADLAACTAYENALEMTCRVTCPAVLVLGQFDKMTPPAQAEGLADTLPSCEISLIPGAGHMMMIEKPYETGRALKALL